MNFDTPYHRNDFTKFVQNFLPDDFTPTVQTVDYQAKFTQAVTKLGESKSLDLEVFEVRHTSTQDARVGLSRETFKLMQTCSYRNRALIAFAPADSSGQWRFSLLQIELEQKDKSARLTRNYNNPRRYSFLLGEGSKVKTPQQFLIEKGKITNFEDLQKRFSVEVLTKEFYKELFAWYQWALSGEMGVAFPNETDNKKIEEHLIRLITRLMFVWFIKQRNLIPNEIFDEEELSEILKDFDANSTNSSIYYNAILQNLFFATLNRPINEREFACEGGGRWNEDYGIKTKFRDDAKDTYFKKTQEEIVALFRQVPFLNGGLFECLDKEQNNKIVYFDGFSRARKKRTFIPNVLFFDAEKGLISILKKYNFTIEENTPADVEVALDPELLGKVFENLLGAYNPETKETARKQSGSFYTPREIVNYMVDESLKAYLSTNGIPAVEVGKLFAESTNGISAVVAENIGDRDVTGTVNINDRDVVDTFSTFFSPYNEIEIHAGNLPHWQQKNVWYFITFRLADSLPLHVVEKVKEEREIWLKQHDISNLTKEKKIEYYKLFSERIEDILNAGYGSCALKDPKIAKIVEDALLHFNNQRYIIDEYIIMPNHVHLLVKPLNDNKLPQILHSWKSFTANEINKVLGKKGEFWMKESYDHIVRNLEAFNAFRNYIKNNPVKVPTASLPLSQRISATGMSLVR